MALDAGDDKGYTKSFLQCSSSLATSYKASLWSSICALAAGSRGLISAAPTFPSVSDTICVSELDYGEDLPLGPGLHSLGVASPPISTPPTVAVIPLNPTQ